MAQYIEFTPEQKERAATVDLEEFLLRQGEKLIKSGREKRLASDHSITVRGCEWFDHASNEGGRAVSFIQKYYGKSYIEAMSMLLGESVGPVYPQAKKQEMIQQKTFCTACSEHEYAPCLCVSSQIARAGCRRGFIFRPEENALRGRGASQRCVHWHG